MIDYQKLLQKNKDYQKSLEIFKEFIQTKIDRKNEQIESLHEILSTIPNLVEEINLKEKCSSYLSLEVLHDSKQRKIYQYNKLDLEIIKQDQLLNPITTPDYIRKIMELRKKNIISKKSDYNPPRFRQQCKKKTKSTNNSQLTTPKKTTQIRDTIIFEIVNCLPIDAQQINWALVAPHSTQLLNLYTSDQVSIEPIEIYRVWLKKYHELYKPQFNDIEDNELTKIVQLVGDNQWAYISKLIITKTSIQLRERWFKVLNKQIKRKRWTVSEDLKLVILVDYFGVGQWNKLHQFFNNRTEVQIRERWCNVLDPELEVRQWNEDEEGRLLQLQKLYGNAWSVISLKLKRTDNECRRRFQQIKIKK